MLDLTKLNKEQQKAVQQVEGPVSVLAGAGTGKTRTLTYRIAYMIYEGIPVSEIVAMTFTNKAAFEMKQRVIDLVGPKAEEISISTFHSFCARFLRNEIHHFDDKYTSRFLIIDEEDSKQIIRDTVKELDYDSNDYNSNRLKNKFSKFKNRQLDYLDFDDLLIYRAYNKYLRDNNSLDFDDLINYTVELLEKNDKIRQYYNERYKYLLVDEFQDTNIAQYELIKLLSGKNRNIFTVGDPDQSIYAFRGANYNNQKRFIEEYNPKIVILEENYRSTNKILEAANRLISNNFGRIGEKELRSSLGDGSDVIFETRHSDIDEAYFVTRAINILVNGNYKYSDIAVLYRSNTISRIFEEAFLKAQIPYVIYGGTSFFARKEIKDILAYIRVVLNPNDNISLKRIINTPRRKIGQVTVSKLENYANLYNMSLYDALTKVDLGRGTNENLKQFKNILKTIEEEVLKAKELEDIIDIVNNLSGYRDMLINEGEESKDRLENMQELKAIFYNARLENNGTNIEILEKLLDDLALITNVDIDDSYNTVKLSTVHQVKGLEFKVVFLVALEETIFPAQASMLTRTDLEEERRICYVGATRAKERLILSHANQRYRFGSLKQLEQSRYIREMKPEEDSIQIRVKEQDINSDEKAQINLGDKVVHDTFGPGLVVSLDDEIIKVAFKIEFGVKIFTKGHPALKKVK